MVVFTFWHYWVLYKVELSLKSFLINHLRINMNNKTIGIVLIVVGVALALWGYDIYESAGSKIERALSGDTPIEAWIGMVGGVICLLIGLQKVK
jgi:uncharacterized membrane protein YidH (DUF202 family)